MSGALRLRRVHALLAVIMLFVSACGGDDADDSEAAGDTSTTVAAGDSSTTEAGDEGAGAVCGPADEPFKVGVTTAVSGPAAAFGEQEAQAAEMLFDEINESGGINGRQVEVTVRDNATDPQQASLDARDFVDNEVDVVMAGATSSAMRAIEPFAEDVLIVNFGSGYEPPLPSQIFSVSPYDSTPVSTTLRWFSDNDITRFGLISSTDATGEFAVAAVEEALEGSAGEGLELVQVERFDPGAPDVTAQLTRLREADPEAVISWVSGGAAGVVARNFTQLGFDIPLVVSWANGGFAFAESTASFAPDELFVPVVKGVVYDQLDDSDPFVARGADFAQRFEEATGDRADIGAMLAHDPVQVVAHALENGCTIEERVEAIESIEGLEGVFGTYTFSETDHKGGGGENNEALIMAQVTDGALTVAETAG